MITVTRKEHWIVLSICFMAFFASLVSLPTVALAQNDRDLVGQSKALPEQSIYSDRDIPVDGMNRDNYRLQHSNIDRERLDRSSIDYDRLDRSNFRSFRSPFGRID